MRRAIVLPFLTALLFSLVPLVSSPLAETVVRFDPATIVFNPENCTGETFTLALRVDDVADLSGFGFEITWNTLYLEHVSHVLTIPAEEHPGGLLYGNVVIGENAVDRLQGTYRCAARIYAGHTFTGNGTAFEITFRLKYQPQFSSLVVTTIEITSSILQSTVNTIIHSIQNCEVRIPTGTTGTIVKLNPATVELGPDYCVGETFTLAAKVDNVAMLCGLGFQIKWNTTYLKHMSHTVMMPYEEHLGGIIHRPIIIVADSVNEIKGTYDCAASTLGGAPYYGSGTAFQITFRVIYQPLKWEPDVHFQVKFTLHDLVDPYACGCIPHSLEHCNVTIHTLAATVVKFDPATVELGPAYCVGETFTLKARIDNVAGLCGIGLSITWNTTYLEYVSHIITMPVENYPNGILHSYVLIEFDMIDEVLGTYWMGASSFGGTTFNGSGTALEITFKVKYQPINPGQTVTLPLEFTYHHLVRDYCCIIPHTVQNCNVIIQAYPNWSIADINWDLKVDIADIILALNAYGSTPEDVNWNPLVDIAPLWNRIDILDLVTITYHYGEEYTP